MVMLLSLKLPNSTSLSIVNEIGTNYEQFGTLLLKDESGKRMEIIEHDERKVDKIITRILCEWFEGSGLLPTWGTLLRVFKTMELHILAENVACSVNYMLHKHDEQ